MQSAGTAPATGILLTYNEEKNVEECLDSVRGLCADLIVVDSGSTDQTVALCRRYTDRIYTHDFVDSASQWNWALRSLEIKTPWVLPLDADHRLTPELREEIRQALADPEPDVDSYYSRHIYRFWGVPVRGFKPYTLRVFRAAQTRLDHSEMVDFRFVVEGETRKLRSAVIEENRNEDNIDFWIDKHQRFSSRMATEEALRRGGFVTWSIRPNLFGNYDERIIWFKQRWYKAPLFLRPVAYFMYRYFFRLGVLDGLPGLVYHFMHAFWFRFLVDVKVYRIERDVAAGLVTLDEMSSKVARRFETGDVSPAAVSRVL